MEIKKSILLVTNAFYPELSPRSFRATELAKEFSRRGHDVTVITKYRDHDYEKFLNEIPIKLKMWKGSRLPVLPDFKRKPFSIMSKSVSRIMGILFEYPAIEDMFHVKNALKKETGYDLMISFAVPYPVQWGVAWASKTNKNISSKWIGDCGDSYMLARLDKYRKPFYFKYLESGFCQRCDYITIPFKELQQQFYPQYRSKIRVVPQGFNFDEVRTVEGKINNEHPVFIFSGTVIPGKRDLNLFLEYLTSLDREFLFIVYTNQFGYYESFKKALGYKLELRSYIDRLQLIYEMSKADFLVNVDTIYDSMSNIEAIPSKLIDYSLAERPILNIISSKPDESLVLEFLNKDYSRRRVIDKERFNIKVIADKFLSFNQ